MHNDPHLTGLCKQLRHDLAAALSPISTDSRMAARETQATSAPADAHPRNSAARYASSCGANFARLQESLRSLEEFGKLAEFRHPPLPLGEGQGVRAERAKDSPIGPHPSPVPRGEGTGIDTVFKQLRYRTYTLERAMEITRGSTERLASVRLYVLVDGRDSPDEFERLVVSLIRPASMRFNFATSNSTMGNCWPGRGCCGR